MDKTHTPGPWRYCDQTDFIMAHDNQMLVADIRGYGFLTGVGTMNLSHRKARGIMDSNARLIAAAPELLEALEAVVNAYNEPDKVSMIDSIGKAGDLIAKINGQGDREKTINASQQRT